MNYFYEKNSLTGERYYLVDRGGVQLGPVGQGSTVAEAVHDLEAREGVWSLLKLTTVKRGNYEYLHD